MIQNHVTNRELSQQLVDAGIVMDTYFVWERHEDSLGQTTKWELMPEEQIDKYSDTIPAPMSSELFEIMPNRSVDIEIRQYKQDNAYWCELIRDSDCEYFVGGEEREVDARAKMLLYLLKEGIVTVESLRKGER